MTAAATVTLCAHCGRVTRDVAGGFASIGSTPVCHPNTSDRPDCFRMITVYGHPTYNCERCTQQPWEPLTEGETITHVIAALTQMQEMARDLRSHLGSFREDQAQ